MINILIPNIDNKFFRNLSITNIPNTKIVTHNVQGNIYSLYYRYNFNILIIPSSLIDNSILQFSIEYMNNVKTIIDVDSKLSEEFLETYNNIFMFLVDENQLNSYKKYKHIEKSKYFINDQIYTQNKETNKTNFIACFLDDIMLLPTNLIDKLYPNNNFKIRMFNNRSINHPQNLGLINEIDKASILNSAEYYLDINDGMYNIEAYTSGCKIINLNSIDKLEPIVFNVPSYTTYSKFIQDCIII